MLKFLKQKSFIKDILPVILFVAVVAVVAITIVVVFLHSDDTSQASLNDSQKTIEEIKTSPKSTTTPKPTASPRTAYIPDPEELQKIPDIDTLDLVEDSIIATNKLNISWDINPDADYYLLCILDGENNVLQKEILWANIAEWEVADFEGINILLLSYKDMGEDSAQDDNLIDSYFLTLEKETSAIKNIDAEIIPEKKYYILVDKEDFAFSILTYDENLEYTKVIATFPCALGRSSRMTPTGKFAISSKGDWKTWKTGEYSPYYTRYTSGLYIHGSLYSKKSYDSLIANYYDRIGTNHTGGCIRTTLEGSRWVYYNCPSGTVVEIVASSDIVSYPGKVEIDSEFPTWDPTDPNKPSA